MIAKTQLSFLKKEIKKQERLCIATMFKNISSYSTFSSTPYISWVFMIFSLTLHKKEEKRISLLPELTYNSPFANIISVNGGF